jgi:hypothetical protein
MNRDRIIIHYGPYIYHVNLIEHTDIRVDNPAFDDWQLVLWSAKVAGGHGDDSTFKTNRFHTGLYPTKLDALNAALMSLTTLADVDTESRNSVVMST